MDDRSIIMAERQAPLIKTYDMYPEKAWTTDSARIKSTATNVIDPLHSEVYVSDTVIPIAVHSAVGGKSDGAVPGDILCAALASCIDSTIQIIANRFRIKIIEIVVKVTADVDVRGTLCVDPKVPVAFQEMRMFVDLQIPEPINKKLTKQLFQSSEQCCVVYQTLKSALNISTQYCANNNTY